MKILSWLLTELVVLVSLPYFAVVSRLPGGMEKLERDAEMQRRRDMGIPDVPKPKRAPRPVEPVASPMRA